MKTNVHPIIPSVAFKLLFIFIARFPSFIPLLIASPQSTLWSNNIDRENYLSLFNNFDETSIFIQRKDKFTWKLATSVYIDCD